MTLEDQTDGPLLTSALHARHEALGAKLAEFGGWSMPLEYAGAGVVKEHTAVREAVGVFDVSHLGKATVTRKPVLGGQLFVVALSDPKRPERTRICMMFTTPLPPAKRDP